jgi:hypothetical protein
LIHLPIGRYLIDVLKKMIFHETLIPHLCRRHLKLSWDGAWKLHTKKYKANEYGEFKNCPLELVFRIELMYQQAKRRGYDYQPPPSPHSVSDVPFTQAFKEANMYVPEYTLPMQIIYLQRHCKSCDLSSLV